MNRVTLLAIILLGAGLRFYGIGAKAIWLDEAISHAVAQRPVLPLLLHLMLFDQHPPAYFVLLHAWMAGLGDLPGVIRGLSALFSIATLPVFYVAARRLTDATTALVAVFLLAVAPFHVQYAQEVRMYALLTLAVAAALYCAARVLRPASGGVDAPGVAPWGDWTGLAVAQATVMWTHNTAAVFFPLALNLPILGAIWLQRRWAVAPPLPAMGVPEFLRRWLTAQALAFVIWLPWAAPLVLQSADVFDGFWISSPTLRTVWNTYLTFSFAYIPKWLPGLPLFAVAYAALAVLGALAARRWGIRALLLSLLFTPIVCSLLVSLRRPIYLDRTLIWASLPYLLLLAAGVGELGAVAQRRKGVAASRLVRNAVALAMAGVTAFALFAYYYHSPNEEWDKAAQSIAERAQPGDLILIHADYVRLPFEYYFRRYAVDAELAGLMVAYDGDQAPELKLAEASQAHLCELIDGHERVWLVYSHEKYHDVAGLIPRELGRNLRLAAHQEFIAVQVFEFAGALEQASPPPCATGHLSRIKTGQVARDRLAAGRLQGSGF